MRAFVFPGQGSQAVGMGKALHDAFASSRAVFAEVDDALGQKLSTLMFEGPEAELTLTTNAQPALMATSLAAVAALRSERGLRLEDEAALVAGHSLGEYSALTAVGALPLAAAARLLRLRGEAMQRAVAVGAGAMAAIIGIEPADAASLAAEASREGSPCQVANDNGGGQVVVSGAADAVDRAAAIAKARGIKRFIPLTVSAPFHCSLMAPAAAAMAEALAETTIAVPRVPVVANVTARPERDPDAIRDLLIRQVTATVRWRESVAFMAEHGIETFVECGAGKVLSGLTKRIAPASVGIAVNTPADVELYSPVGA